jgi:hypothetical protein
MVIVSRVCRKFDGLVLTGGSSCRSWFKNGQVHGPVTAIWPGSRLHYFETLSNPRFEDFDVVYWKDGNRFAYLGNGYTETELEEESNPVWYFDVLKTELHEAADAFAVVPGRMILP